MKKVLEVTTFKSLILKVTIELVKLLKTTMNRFKATKSY